MRSNGVPSEELHIVPVSGGGWAVKRPGLVRVDAIQLTQKQALRRAQEMLSRRGGRVVVHNRQGKICAGKYVYKDIRPIVKRVIAENKSALKELAKY